MESCDWKSGGSLGETPIQDRFESDITRDTQMRNPNVDRGLSNEAERLERAQDWDYPALVGVASYPLKTKMVGRVNCVQPLFPTFVLSLLKILLASG